MRRTLVPFGAHAEIDIEQTAMRQVAHVAGFLLLDGKGAGKDLPRQAQSFFGAQQHRVHALADADQNDEVAGHGSLERTGEHQQRHRRAGVPAFGQRTRVALRGL